MSKVICTATHVVDLSDGRTLGPGDVAENVDVDGDEHNKQLVTDGQLGVMNEPPATPYTRDNPVLPVRTQIEEEGGTNQ